MLRIIMVVALAVAASAGEPKEEKVPAIAHAARACTSTTAFGHSFAGQSYGHVDATADDEWAPFERLTIAGNEITADASFHGAGSSAEADLALAKKFRKAFEKAIDKTQKFPGHERHGDGIELRTAREPDRGLVFQIRQDGDHVLATCIELGD